MHSIYSVMAFTLACLGAIVGMEGKREEALYNKLIVAIASVGLLRHLYRSSLQAKAYQRSSFHLILRVGIFTVYTTITFMCANFSTCDFMS